MALLVPFLLLLVLPSHALAQGPGEARVINGNTVADADYSGRWGFIAALLTASQPDAYQAQFCGGSLIAPRIVLTAAHCTEGATASQIDVLTGTRDLNNTAGAQRISVTQIVEHPSYVAVEQGYDVALLKLEVPSTSPTIGLATLAQPAMWGDGLGKPLDGANGPWVAGWGNTCSVAPNCDSYPSQLQEAAVPVVADSTCDDTGAGGYASFSAVSMICAGTLDSDAARPTDGVDTCQGDSGGPLMVSDGLGGWRLTGVTSWGYGCADQNFGVYARVPALESWISEQAELLADSTAPTNPTLTSTSHTVSTYSNVRTMVVSIADATDGDGSGIAGFNIDVNTTANHDPATTVDVSAAATSYTHGTPLAASTTGHYVHVRTKDNAGNWSATTRIGPFPIDLTAPTAPSVSSTTHTAGSWSRNPVIGVSVGGASDTGGAGLASWWYALDGTSGTSPGSTLTHAAATTAFTSASQPSGSRYVHVRAADAAGNASTATEAGPFLIDVNVPGRPGRPYRVKRARTSITIGWSAATDAHSGIRTYRVYRRVGTRWSHVGTTTAGTRIKTVGGLRPGRRYTFAIRAWDAAGNVSSYSYSRTIATSS